MKLKKLKERFKIFFEKHPNIRKLPFLMTVIIPEYECKGERTVSLDRIDNNKGYVKGNITLVTRFENMGRGNMEFEPFMEFCESLRCNTN